MTIRDTDKGYRKQIEALRKLQGVKISFGLFDAKGAGEIHEGSELTIADIGAIHEFGSTDGRIPERSFLRAFFDEYGNDARTALARLAEKIHAEEDRKNALEKFGLLIVGKIKQRISRGIPPMPLADSTLRKKGEGKTTPLINTGQLRNSITFKAEDPAGTIAFPDPSES